MNTCECDECRKYVEHRELEERKLWEAPSPAPSELSAGLDALAAKGRLIYLAGRLLRCQMSSFREDSPKSVPKYMLENIERNNERIKDIAADIRKIADSI